MRADFVDWPSIAADGFPFPEAVPASQLADELSAMLISPDPEIRDDYAYTAAAREKAGKATDQALVDGMWFSGLGQPTFVHAPNRFEEMRLTHQEEALHAEQ
ncbi:hypothetical protein ACIHCV_43780 [Streptomyces sp. NPDC051956]|uniref:hypothetical protein n=1 Tax=Streptomyces sp. NPDC051956 TaxID=3365677 RepID=UPI0037D6F3B9